MEQVELMNENNVGAKNNSRLFGYASYEGADVSRACSTPSFLPLKLSSVAGLIEETNSESFHTASCSSSSGCSMTGTLYCSQMEKNKNTATSTNSPRIISIGAVLLTSTLKSRRIVVLWCTLNWLIVTRSFADSSVSPGKPKKENRRKNDEIPAVDQNNSSAFVVTSVADETTEKVIVRSKTSATRPLMVESSSPMH
uniref:Uncharacterized protein n=1 Tax=Ditylenchus dipsaci TaxID=166011 RepID=A0A915EGU1_9BILA